MNFNSSLESQVGLNVLLFIEALHFLKASAFFEYRISNFYIVSFHFTLKNFNNIQVSETFLYNRWWYYWNVMCCNFWLYECETRANICQETDIFFINIVELLTFVFIFLDFICFVYTLQLYYYIVECINVS